MEQKQKETLNHLRRVARINPKVALEFVKLLNEEKNKMKKNKETKLRASNGL